MGMNDFNLPFFNSEGDLIAREHQDKIGWCTQKRAESSTRKLSVHMASLGHFCALCSDSIVFKIF